MSPSPRKSAPGKAKPVAASRSAQRDEVRPVRTLVELMTQALAMEMEAAQRYAEFADAMDEHNSPEVAAMFRKMAGIEELHARRIMAEMGWKTAPLPVDKPAWKTFEAPETTPRDEIHYLMQPYHVLQLAHLNEQRAMLFFSRIARAATDGPVRKAARELQAEEAEHVVLVKKWLAKVSRPKKNWAVDPDPASSTN